MGLLDDLMGQLVGGVPDAGLERGRPAAPAGGSAGGMGPLLAALLPVALSMLSGARGGQAQGRSATPSGGLGDVLSQVLGGGAGQGQGQGAGGLGGLGALLDQLQRAGFGAEADSWVGTGQNRALPPDAMDRVFGRDGIAEIARRAGVSEQDASRGLAALMPEVVDRVTPEGRVPDDTRLLASVDDLTRKLGLA